MTKEIKTNELEKRELRLDNIETVSGGEYGDHACWFNHEGHKFDFFIDPDDGLKYSAYRCSDCGWEWYEKGDNKVSPSEYYTAKNTVSDKPTIRVVG